MLQAPEPAGPHARPPQEGVRDDPRGQAADARDRDQDRRDLAADERDRLAQDREDQLDGRERELVRREARLARYREAVAAGPDTAKEHAALLRADARELLAHRYRSLDRTGAALDREDERSARLVRRDAREQADVDRSTGADDRST